MVAKFVSNVSLLPRENQRAAAIGKFHSDVEGGGRVLEHHKVFRAVVPSLEPEAPPSNIIT